MFFKRNKVLSKTRKQLKSAIPNLVALLTEEIAYLEDATGDSTDTTTKDYSTLRLVKVLKSSAQVHLKLKLDKQSSQLGLLKYLSPNDTTGQGFSASCQRIVRLIKSNDELKVLHLTELRNIYIYLLSRLD